MDMAGGHGPEDEGDAAERAFEALRAEVATQRGTLERLTAALDGLSQRQAEAAAPDYSPTLGAMARELEAVVARLDGMEGHPALALTPAAHASQLAAGVRRVEEEAGRGLTQTQARFSDGLRQLQGLVSSAHDQLAQERREWIAVAIGVVAGFALWWPLAFLTPGGGGHWLAATLIGGGRWGAAETLMNEANPALWERMVRLGNACPRDGTTEQCEAALAVRAAAPGQEGAKAPLFGTVPNQSRGRSGLGR